MGRLDGDVVVLTGAASGIGRAFAGRLAREGARLALLDIDGDRLSRVAHRCRAAGAEVIEVTVDVADSAAVGQAVGKVADRFGAIHGLVNNAAVFSSLRNQPFERIAPSEIDRVLAVNAVGPFMLCQAVVPHMRRAGRGRIVNMASGALLAAPAGLAHYVMSKGAVFAMTRVLARELGANGITVNSIAPGLTVTDGVRALYPEAFIDAARAARSIARDEEPQDLEGALMFLLSRDSDFVTGQMIVVNGGAQFW